MLKKLKIISKVAEWVVFAFLLCFLFILFSPKLPIKNIPKSFVVVTGSMEPTIKTGSVALVKEVDVKSVKVGDIIAFTSPNNPNDTILHRVASISSTDPLQFKTKGDNNNSVDAWDVMDVGVKGTYITAIPYLGLIAAFIKKPLGFGLVVGIPALIFIIFQLFNIKKAISEEVDRKVSQKLDESKKSDSTKTILKSIIFFILFISTLFAISGIHIIKAVFSDTVTISGISISIADFTKPSVPTLISPENNISRSTKDLVMDWSTVVNPLNPSSLVFYVYQSSHFSDFSITAGYRGYLLDSQVPAPGTPDGVYYWRVKACYTADNCSGWTDPWSVTIDSTLPTSTITSPIISQNHEFTFTATTTPTISDWDGKITGTTTDNSSGVNRVELSIQDLGTSLFLSNTGWTSGTESTVRVNAVGTTTWSYQIGSTYLSAGNFKITSHAIDNADNIENSAIIMFEYVAPTETITPTPTDSVTPTPTEYLVSTPTETITPTPTDSVTPTPTESLVSTPTDTITPTPTDIPTPFPTDILTPTPTEISLPTPTETPVPTETPASVEPVSIIIIQTFNC